MKFLQIYLLQTATIDAQLTIWLESRSYIKQNHAMVNFVSSLLVVAFAARVSATRQLSVDSLELEMMHLQSFAESHHTEEIHQILGHHHDEKPNRNEMLESVLQTGVFPKSKRGQDLTTDELVKDYIDKDYIYPKGRRKYGNIASPNTVGRSYSKEDKKKSVAKFRSVL